MCKELISTEIINEPKCRSERGASMVEYGLLVALIAVVCVVAVQGLGRTVRDNFQQIDTQIGASNNNLNPPPRR